MQSNNSPEIIVYLKQKRYNIVDINPNSDAIKCFG